MSERIQLQPKILEVNETNDIYMTVKLVLLTSNVNLNGLRFTENFIHDIVTNQHVYYGIPLVVNRLKAENRVWNSLNHEFYNGELHTDIIGSFVSFEERQNLEDNSWELIGEARILKRFPATCEAIIELYSMDQLHFSCEVLVNSYSKIENGIREIDAGGGVLIGQAIVSQPAEPKSKPLLLVAALEKDLEVNIKKEDIGTGKKIEIDNSVENASDTPWGQVNKTQLRNDLMKASNYKSLVKEAYLIVDNGFEDSPSSSLHYPHHVISNGKLVISKTGVIAARQRLAANDPDNISAISHLKKHYKVLNMPWDNTETSSTGGVQMKFKIEKADISYKEMHDQMNEMMSKLSKMMMTKRQMQKIMQDVELSQIDTEMLNDIAEMMMQIMGDKMHDQVDLWVPSYGVFQNFFICKEWYSSCLFMFDYVVENDEVIISNPRLAKIQYIEASEFEENGLIKELLNLYKEKQQLNSKIKELETKMVELSTASPVSTTTEGTDEMQKQINELNEKIISMGKTIEELNSTIEFLKPYKEQVEKEKIEREIAELKEKFGSILPKEVFELESTQTLIQERKVNELNALAAEEMFRKAKAVKELNSKKEGDVVITVNTEGKNLLPENIMEEYLKNR